MPRQSPQATSLTDKIPQQEKSEGESSQEIMTRHLLNKDDVITDEDFRNLKIEVEALPEEINSRDFLNDKDRPKDEDKDPENLTPWDVIK